MNTFSDELKDRLIVYKKTRLGIQQNGFWRQKEYSHILPKECMYLNILEPIRKECIEYIRNNKIEKLLHEGFPHLNSSQAMCFNLFFPLIQNKQLGYFLSLIGLNDWNIEDYQFEKVLNTKEGTNFDFWIIDKSGKELFVEAKLTETNFGKGKIEKYLSKKMDIYESGLKDIVDSIVIDSNLFYDYYQLLRNIYYLKDRSGGSSNKFVCVITSKNNKTIISEYMTIYNYIKPLYQKYIQIVFFEDLVNNCINKYNGDISFIYKMFKEKYCI